MTKHSYVRVQNVTMKHRYWNRTNPALFQFRLADHSQESLDKLGARVNHKLNGIEVGVPEYNMGSFNQLKALDYKVICLDPALKNYSSDLDFVDNEVAFYQVTEDGKYNKSVEPIVRSLGLVYSNEDISVLGNNLSKNVLDDYLDGLSGAEIASFIDHNNEGFYTSNVESFEHFIFEKSITKKLFAWVSIPVTMSEEITLEIDTREVRLEYIVETNHHDPNTLNLVDETGDESDFTFDKTVIDNRAVFMSENPIKWKEGLDARLLLMNGKSKPILEGLPTSTNKSLKYDENQNPYLEIFIHL